MLFKKITSNRDPGDTVLRAVKNEFNPYFQKAGKGMASYAKRYPKFLFVMMIINIALSIVLCLTVFRPIQRPVKIVLPAPGFDRILQAGAALSRTIQLKQQVDSLSHKNRLSAADSDRLDSDLSKLQRIKSLTHEH